MNHYSPHPDCTSLLLYQTKREKRRLMVSHGDRHESRGFRLIVLSHRAKFASSKTHCRPQAPTTHTRPLWQDITFCALSHVTYADDERLHHTRTNTLCLIRKRGSTFVIITLENLDVF